MVELISDAIDKKEYSIGLFIDLKKAFDTIDHYFLQDKLYLCGIRRVALNWVKSFSSNHKQYVELNGQKSNQLLIICGVPQGSILGPLLFILYINDLCNISSVLKFIKLADDTNIFYSNENLNVLFEVMNKELQTLTTWFSMNRLSLNVKKTNYILFSNKNVKKFKGQIKIDSTEVDRVENTKFLGINIDEKLNWKDQILHIENKVSRGIGLMYRSKGRLDSKSLLMLYSAVILPYLHYCAEIWGNTYDCRIDKLIKLQNQAMRLIGSLKYRDSTSNTYNAFICLKL